MFVRSLRTPLGNFGKRRIASANTIDQNELQNFKTMSSEWWREFGPAKALHSMNKLRVPFIRDRLVNLKRLPQTPKPLQGLQILDVGCGGGILSEPLARLGGNVTGLDASNEMIEVAKSHAEASRLPNLSYVSDSIEGHTLQNEEKYDALVVSEVLEHVTHKGDFLDLCVKCLKPGGSLLVTTMNRTAFAWAFAIVAAENLFSFVPRGTHEIDKFISPHKLQGMLEERNCHVALVHGMMYNVFTNRWSWTKDTCINYALHAVKDE